VGRFFIPLHIFVLVALLDALEFFLVFLMPLQDERISTLSFKIVLNEIEGSGCFNAKESRVKCPKREIVDADRPRGVAFVLLNNFLFESLKVGLILQGLRLFLASIRRRGLILAIIVKRRRLFCYVLKDILSFTVFFEVSQFGEAVEQIELAVEVLSHPLQFLRCGILVDHFGLFLSSFGNLITLLRVDVLPNLFLHVLHPIFTDGLLVYCLKLHLTRGANAGDDAEELMHAVLSNVGHVSLH
jgi:hypothetical protein